MRRPMSSRPLVAFTAMFFVACGDGGSKEQDTQTAADSTAETALSDTSVAADSAATTAAPDSVATDGADTADAPDSAADTAEPTEVADTEDGDTNSCEYYEEPRLMDCGETLQRALYWQDFSGSGCPAYYTYDDVRYATFEAMATAASCVPGCEYTATISIDALSCTTGHRTGFDQYVATGQGCGEAVYDTPGGTFKDICDWIERACYCEDQDEDGTVDGDDNCPGDANEDQADGDADGIGDVCDPCGADPENDGDSDGVCGDVDNCPTVSNPPSDCDSNASTPVTQCDSDGDGVGDVCDR